jgi:hypothetical protein
MAKRAPSLAETMKSVAPAAKPYFAASREGMKRITVAISPEDHTRLKIKAAESHRSIESLMREAVAAVLAKKH